MVPKITFIHTMPALTTTFSQLCQQILPPQVELLHIADEILLRVVLAQGGLSPFIFRRVAQHVIAAEEAGATLVQFTCCSISPCASICSQLVTIPVLKIDEPMVDRALELGSRISVIATAPTTLKPTTNLVKQQAAHKGQDVQVEATLVEGALAALLSGNQQEHDRLVRTCIFHQMQHAQVVILAQASMARLLDTIPAQEQVVPLLTSPRLAIERLCTYL